MLRKTILPLTVLIVLFAFQLSFSLSQNPIAILLSSEDVAYTTPVKTFESEVSLPVKVYNLEGNVKNAPAVMEEIYKNNHPLIFTLGAKATYVAKIESSKQKRNDIPIVFAMVLNWERYDLLKDSPHIAGVSTDMDPGTQFANLNLFAPHIKKVGVIYSKTHSSKKIEKASAVSKLLNIQLLSEPIEHHKEFREAFNRIYQHIDAFWILTDPVIFTPRNMDWLKNRCIKHKIPSIGQSENVANLGILLAINIDMKDIGVQSASIANNIIFRKQSPESIGVMPPLGTSLILNAGTADKINLRINEDAKNMANKIIEE